jgi:hypothetical protein
LKVTQPLHEAKQAPDPKRHAEQHESKEHSDGPALLAIFPSGPENHSCKEHIATKQKWTLQWKSRAPALKIVVQGFAIKADFRRLIGVNRKLYPSSSGSPVQDAFSLYYNIDILQYFCAIFPLAPRIFGEQFSITYYQSRPKLRSPR